MRTPQTSRKQQGGAAGGCCVCTSKAKAGQTRLAREKLEPCCEACTMTRDQHEESAPRPCTLELSTPHSTSSHLCGVNTEDFGRVQLLQFLNVCDQCVSYPNSPHDQRISEKIFQVELSFQTGGLLTGLLKESDDFNHCPKRSYWSRTGSPNRRSQGVFPSDKRS